MAYNSALLVYTSRLELSQKHKKKQNKRIFYKKFKCHSTELPRLYILYHLFLSTRKGELFREDSSKVWKESGVRGHRRRRGGGASSQKGKSPRWCVLSSEFSQLGRPASAVSVEQTADALRALRPGQAAQSEVGSDPCEGRRA